MWFIVKEQFYKKRRVVNTVYVTTGQSELVTFVQELQGYSTKLLNQVLEWIWEAMYIQKQSLICTPKSNTNRYGLLLKAGYLCQGKISDHLLGLLKE